MAPATDVEALRRRLTTVGALYSVMIAAVQLRKKHDGDSRTTVDIWKNKKIKTQQPENKLPTTQATD
jgi:hypothetical protein